VKSLGVWLAHAGGGDGSPSLGVPVSSFASLTFSAARSMAPSSSTPGGGGDRGRRAPVDNLCATCREDVDRAGSAGDFAVDNLVGAVDNGCGACQPYGSGTLVSSYVAE
jgi:hypothetical protein